MIIQNAIPVAILLLCQTPASAQGVCNMDGYLKLVYIENSAMLYRNNELDFFKITKSIDSRGNEILFSNVPKDKMEKMASLKLSFKLHGYNAFWLDRDRCFYIDNSGNKKIIGILSGSVGVSDLNEEAHKLYDFPTDGNFLGRSAQFVFWSQDSVFFWRNPETGVVDSAKCPKYVKAISGAIGLSNGKVAIFASGKNPSFFSGHPGWSGVLSFDFAGRSFSRIE